MAATTTTAMRQQFRRIAAAWPVDPFRTVQLKTFFESLAEHPNLTPQAVSAANALQNNEFQKKFAVSDRTLRPASMPHHYERLVEGFEKSAKGIGRPWWKIFFRIW